MSFKSSDVDKSTKPKVGREDLEQFKFLVDLFGRVGIRIGNEFGSGLHIAGGVPEWDEITTSYPDNTTEIYVYKKATVTVMTLTITYETSDKELISTVTRV